MSNQDYIDLIDSMLIRCDTDTLRAIFNVLTNIIGPRKAKHGHKG